MRLTVIGGGPGGYTAAFAAARRGLDVTLVEKDGLGGACLHNGCIPTKALRASADALLLAGRLSQYGVSAGGAPALDLEAVRRRKEKIVALLEGGLEGTCAQLGIRRLRGTGQVRDARTALVRGEAGETVVTGDAVLLATGSRPLDLPGLPCDGQHICTSDDALRLERVPRRLVIVGGGVIGCEMACIFQAFGSEVTIVEGQDRLLPLPSTDHEVSALLQREMRKRKIAFVTGATLADVRVEGGLVRGMLAPSPLTRQPAAHAAGKALEADMALVTVGRAPATQGLGLREAGVASDARGWVKADARMATSVPGIYAVGDMLGPGRAMLAHVAAMEGLCVVDGLCGDAHPMRYEATPSAVFTAPEIGQAGMSEEQARAAGRRVACGVALMRQLGRAHAMGELPGFFKVVADAETGRLLGAHIVGAHASDLVAEAGLALSAGLTVRQIAGTIHAHPTLAEGLWEAARAALRQMEG